MCFLCSSDHTYRHVYIYSICEIDILYFSQRKTFIKEKIKSGDGGFGTLTTRNMDDTGEDEYDIEEVGGIA